jgi:transposase-like protein
MDSGWLARQLGEGRSIESIAREVGLHSSTVSYWVEKHGLRSRHAEKHASRGPINREELADLIEEHLSVRGIAERLGVSSTTVRYWLERYDLRTIRAQRRDLSKLGRSQDLQAVPGVCPKHGDVWLVRRDYGYRCQRCRSEAVTARRQRIKAQLIDEAGGQCLTCGYAGTPAALHFHHIDPATKRFAVSHRGLTRSLDEARSEVARCVLLCANCHAEVEAGARKLPFGDSEPSGVAQTDPG